MRKLFLALLLSTSPALAEVSFNPDTGTGHVPRSDLVAALGSDAAKQGEIVEFEFLHTYSTTTLCRQDGTTKTFTRTQVLVRGLDASPDAGQPGNWELTGFSGEERVRGRNCPLGWRRAGAPTKNPFTKARVRALWNGEQGIVWRR